MILGVPVGETVAARKLLTQAVESAVRSARTCERLCMPIAQVACMASGGIYHRLKWRLEAVAAGVIDDTLLAYMVAQEDAAVRSLFGAVVGPTVPQFVVQQIQLPCEEGGLDLSSVEAHIHLDGRGKLRWFDRRSTEYVDFMTARVEAIRAEARKQPQQLRRLDEQRTAKGDALRWLARFAHKYVVCQRETIVEVVLMCGLFGVDVTTLARAGAGDSLCPAHARAKPRFMSPDGDCTHVWKCKRVQDRRHDAGRDALFDELVAYFPQTDAVMKEVSISSTGVLYKRRYGARADGEKAPGDVVVKGPCIRIFDVTVSSGYAKADKQAPSIVGYDKKKEAWRKLEDDGLIPKNRFAFTPVAISPWGAVAGGTKQVLVPMLGNGGVGKAAVRRVAFAVLLEQAVAVAELLVTAVAADDAVRVGHRDRVGVAPARRLAAAAGAAAAHVAAASAPGAAATDTGAAAAAADAVHASDSDDPQCDW